MRFSLMLTPEDFRQLPKHMRIELARNLRHKVDRERMKIDHEQTMLMRREDELRHWATMPELDEYPDITVESLRRVVDNYSPNKPRK